MLHEYLLFWKNAINSGGKTGPRTFQVTFLVNIFIIVILNGLTFRITKASANPGKGLVALYASHGAIGLLTLLVMFAMIVPSLTLFVRRLNSMDKPLVYLLRLLIPGYNLYIIYQMMTVSDVEVDEESIITGYQEADIETLSEVAMIPEVQTHQTSKSDLKSKFSVHAILATLGFIRKDGLGDIKQVLEFGQVDGGETIRVDKNNGNFKVPLVRESKPPFFMKLILKSEYKWLEELRYLPKEQIIVGRNRFIFGSIGLIVFLITMASGGSIYLAVGALGFSAITIYDRYARLKREYQNYIFEKQVQYSKFARTVVPYAMNSSDYPMYEILRKISHRMRIEAAYRGIESADPFVADTVVLSETIPDFLEVEELFPLESRDDADDAAMENSSVVMADVPDIPDVVELQEGDVI